MSSVNDVTDCVSRIALPTHHSAASPVAQKFGKERQSALSPLRALSAYRPPDKGATMNTTYSCEWLGTVCRTQDMLVSTRTSSLQRTILRLNTHRAVVERERLAILALPQALLEGVDILPVFEDLLLLLCKVKVRRGVMLPECRHV